MHFQNAFLKCISKMHFLKENERVRIYITANCLKSAASCLLRRSQLQGLLSVVCAQQAKSKAALAKKMQPV